MFFYFVEDLRNLSAAVYAFILLVIGIPLWWRMTEVQRHPLPYAQISQLGSMDTVIATDIFVYTKNPSETERIIEHIYTTFNSSNILQYIQTNGFLISKLNIPFHFTAMFSVKAQPSTLIRSDDTLDKLEAAVTPLGSLQLIETNNVDSIMAGLGRNVYFPPATGKRY